MDDMVLSLTDQVLNRAGLSSVLEFRVMKKTSGTQWLTILSVNSRNVEVVARKLCIHVASQGNTVRSGPEGDETSV